MTDQEKPKMGFLQALQAKKEQTNGTESKAAAPAPQQGPKIESRTGGIFGAFGKATQKTESRILGKVLQPSHSKGIHATVDSPGKSGNTKTSSEDVKESSAGDEQNEMLLANAEDRGIVEEAAAGIVPSGTGSGSATTPFANRLLAAAKAAKEADPRPSYDHLFDAIPENFQDVVDKFDALLSRDNAINEMNIGHLRNYVQRIFVDLKNNPEYDGMIIDRDVHNIIKFMRAVKSEAQDLAIDKKEKKAKADSNKVKKNKFAAVAGNLDMGALPMNLDAVAGMGDDFEDMP